MKYFTLHGFQCKLFKSFITRQGIIKLFAHSHSVNGRNLFKLTPDRTKNQPMSRFPGTSPLLVEAFQHSLTRGLIVRIKERNNGLI